MEGEKSEGYSKTKVGNSKNYTTNKELAVQGQTPTGLVVVTEEEKHTLLNWKSY
jgi:hypothetical protein